MLHSPNLKHVITRKQKLYLTDTSMLGSIETINGVVFQRIMQQDNLSFQPCRKIILPNMEPVSNDFTLLEDERLQQK